MQCWVERGQMGEVVSIISHFLLYFTIESIGDFILSDGTHLQPEGVGEAARLSQEGMRLEELGLRPGARGRVRLGWS